MKAARRAWLAIAVAGIVVGCRGETQVPEPGSLLLRVNLVAGASMPDELRLSAYDDGGTLWNGARFPAEGALVPQSASFLGTVLLQPGTTVGALRIDLRGLQGGTMVDEGTLMVTPADRSKGTFDVMLSAALPSDTDGDGVPDPIDDCPTVPDPAQTGCGRDAGAGDGAAGSPAGGAGEGGVAGTTGTGGQAGTTGTGGAAGTAGTGSQAGTAGGAGHDGGAGGSSNLPQGAACGAANQCASGFCKDGACCDSACTTPCNSCTTGTCKPVQGGTDAPECVAPMTCNPKGKCAGA